jgi:hypothetical protein
MKEAEAATASFAFLGRVLARLNSACERGASLRDTCCLGENGDEKGTGLPERLVSVNLGIVTAWLLVWGSRRHRRHSLQLPHQQVVRLRQLSPGREGRRNAPCACAFLDHCWSRCHRRYRRRPGCASLLRRTPDCIGRAQASDHDDRNRAACPVLVLETFGPPVKLIRGRITADFTSGISATFTVPSGWYGYQSDGEFEIAKSLPSPDLAKAFQFGGIAVHTVDDRLADVLRELETSASYRVFDDATVHIGGYSGRPYIFEPREAVPLGELLGVPASSRRTSSSSCSAHGGR